MYIKSYFHKYVRTNQQKYQEIEKEKVHRKKKSPLLIYTKLLNLISRNKLKNGVVFK